jgi:FlaA1/EpsC-like NDP-sugar epimerase
MKIFFAKKTFSKQVLLQWWVNLQQQYILGVKILVGHGEVWKIYYNAYLIHQLRYGSIQLQGLLLLLFLVQIFYSLNLRWDHLRVILLLMIFAWIIIIMNMVLLLRIEIVWCLTRRQRLWMLVLYVLLIIMRRNLLYYLLKIWSLQIPTSDKHCVGASASFNAAIIPSKEHQKVLLLTTRSHEKEQDVQSSCVADNEPHIDDIIDNISTGLPMITREAQSNSTIVDDSGHRSNVFQSKWLWGIFVCL